MPNRAATWGRVLAFCADLTLNNTTLKRSSHAQESGRVDRKFISARIAHMERGLLMAIVGFASNIGLPLYYICLL